MFFTFTTTAPGVRVASLADGDLTATLTRRTPAHYRSDAIVWEWRVDTFGEYVDGGETFGTYALPVARERAELALANLAPCFEGI